MIVSGDNRGSVWLWDAQGNAIGQPLTSVGSVISARFGADDETVAVITGDGVTIWNGGNWEDWLETACQRLQYHPILETEERQGARRVCQRYVWEHQWR